MAADEIEEPAFDVVYRLDKVEIRRYAPSVQAITRLQSDRRSGAGFQRLAGFIFGGNDDGQSIAMTAPVQESLGEGEVEMAFTMPSEYAFEELPAPEDSRVVLRQLPERTMAVVEFGGWATSGRIRSHLRTLEEGLASAGLEPVGLPQLNQYNPPWTPPFLRRNEVMIEVVLPVTAMRSVPTSPSSPARP
jgi:hypothetical protein